MAAGREHGVPGEEGQKEPRDPLRPDQELLWEESPPRAALESREPQEGGSCSAESTCGKAVLGVRPHLAQPQLAAPPGSTGTLAWHQDGRACGQRPCGGGSAGLSQRRMRGDMGLTESVSGQGTQHEPKQPPRH